MPYKGEKAGKTGHASFVKNEDVNNFLSSCAYMRPPENWEGSELAACYSLAPGAGSLPEIVIACDGSSYCAPLNEGKLPSTQIGYVKSSLAMLNFQEYLDLKNSREAYIDPYKVAALHKKAEAVSFVLPGSNIIYKESPDVASGFRKAIYDQCSDERTNWVRDERFTMVDTLFDLCGDCISIDKCPACGYQKEGLFDTFIFNRDSRILQCPDCHGEVYVTDILRIHEQLSDFGDNNAAITRFMNVFEHLLIASLANMLFKKNRKMLSGLAFILDGPLAIFGQPAKIHARLMAFYEKVRREMSAAGFTPPIIMGVQKTGALVDHARLVASYLPSGSYALVSDAYRSKYVAATKETAYNFGHETYYGQDFIFKTESGRVFILGLPYPFEKKSVRTKFAKEKSKVEEYGDMPARAFDIIRQLECDLYSDSLVPVMLAHRHASISFVPGGNVLGLLAKLGLEGKI